MTYLSLCYAENKFKKMKKFKERSLSIRGIAMAKASKIAFKKIFPHFLWMTVGTSFLTMLIFHTTISVIWNIVILFIAYFTLFRVEINIQKELLLKNKKEELQTLLKVLKKKKTKKNRSRKISRESCIN